MTAPAVHWHEGMFLRPHHLQAAARHAAEQLHTAGRWDQHYSRGLRAFDLDRDALANHRFVVRRLRLRLRDGTLVSLPEEGTLPALDLKPHLDKESTLTVFLGIPALHVGRANVAGPTTEGGRYLVDSQELEDENTGLNPQGVPVRRLNLKVLTSAQDQGGYEVLPLARVEKSGGAEAAPQLHLPYVPPLLACDAWLPLQLDVLRAVYDRVGRKIELLADQVVTRGLALGASSPADALTVGQLQVLNEAYALWHVLAFAEGIHPLTAYAELCRLVGQLAVFGQLRRPPELPHYDHDDLGHCFWQVKKHLDALLDDVREPEYKLRPFEGAGKRMQVTLEPAWLEAAWQMFVGVKSPLPAEECVALLTRGQLDMKIGSSEHVDNIDQRGAEGLRVA
jgi:type VI secretion system protein ImpJ